MIDPRSRGPAQLQRAVEGFRDQIRLRFPRTLAAYQTHVRPRLPGDTRHYEFSKWAADGLELIRQMTTKAVHFEGGEIWIEDPEGGEWLYTPWRFGSAIWSEFGLIYEKDEIELLATLLPEQGVMLDVGANVGLHAIKLSQKVPGLRVFSFEPVRETFDALQRNIARNGAGEAVKPRRTAISDDAGVLVMTARSGPGNFVVPDGMPGENEHVERVEKTPLDAIVDDLTDRVDFIKVDVEGHELAALGGAAYTIERYKPVIFVEIMERYARRYGHTTGEVFALLRSYGYDYQSVAEGKLLPRSATPAQDLKLTTNFLFRHPAKDRG